MSTTGRILELLSLLQNHRYWSGEDLARRLGVSPRTLRRDVEQLRDLGYPVETSRGVGGGYQLTAGGSLPPLVIDDEEAIAIVLGLRAASTSGIAGVADGAVRALAKVVAVLPVRLRRTANDMASAIPRPERRGAASEVDVGVLTAAAAACRDRETLRFGYRKADDSRSARHVEPHALVPYGGRWYLAAYDLDARDWRTFRLDRISDIEPGRRGFRPRELPGGDAAAYVVAGVSAIAGRYQVDVTVDVPADRVRAEVAQWGRVVEVTPGVSRLLMRVDTLDWVAFILGCLDAPFTVHEPPELLDYLDGWAERFKAASGG